MPLEAASRHGSHALAWFILPKTNQAAYPPSPRPTCRRNPRMAPKMPSNRSSEQAFHLELVLRTACVASPVAFR